MRAALLSVERSPNSDPTPNPYPYHQVRAALLSVERSPNSDPTPNPYPIYHQVRAALLSVERSPNSRFDLEELFDLLDTHGE